jgi:hypothetical protein
VLPALFDWETLKEQAPEFISMMRSRTKKAKSTSLLWRGIGGYDASRAVVSEWVKLAQLYMTIPIGSVDNERRFSRMKLVKTAVRNRLETPHLNTCMQVSSSHFTQYDYPYRAAHKIWQDAKDRRHRR